MRVWISKVCSLPSLLSLTIASSPSFPTFLYFFSLGFFISYSLYPPSVTHLVTLPRESLFSPSANDSPWASSYFSQGKPFLVSIEVRVSILVLVLLSRNPNPLLSSSTLPLPKHWVQIPSCHWTSGREEPSHSLQPLPIFYSCLLTQVLVGNIGFDHQLNWCLKFSCTLHTLFCTPCQPKSVLFSGSVVPSTQVPTAETQTLLRWDTLSLSLSSVFESRNLTLGIGNAQLLLSSSLKIWGIMTHEMSLIILRLRIIFFIETLWNCAIDLNV